MGTHVPDYRIFEQIHIEEAKKQGLTGKGVCVAILDTGIGFHQNFGWKQGRVLAFYDTINGKTYPYDDNSHGSHVAGIIGANGYNLAGFPIGIAPNCFFVIVKVLDQNGNGKVSNMIKGLQWVRENKERFGISIVNISIGTPVKGKNDEGSAVVLEVEKTWDCGLIVIVAAGNNGPSKKSITIPGISRKVITVGSCDEELFMGEDSKKRYYSGRGPTIGCVKKPDIVAPGANIASCSPFQTGYTVKSGTSMSTPVVSGGVALLMEKYPFLSNRQVKQLLWERSDDLGLPWQKQGYGKLNLARLLQ